MHLIINLCQDQILQWLLRFRYLECFKTQESKSTKSEQARLISEIDPLGKQAETDTEKERKRETEREMGSGEKITVEIVESSGWEMTTINKPGKAKMIVGLSMNQRN